MKVEYLGDFKTKCVNELGASLETAAPKGDSENFSPTDLLALSLASCMLTLIAMKGKELGIKFEKMSADVQKEMGDTPKRRITKLIVRIRCSYSPNSIEQQKLEAAALSCPVHLSLHPDIEVEYDFVWGL